MNASVFPSKKPRLLIQTGFILIWMTNFINAGIWLPLYLLLGTAGVFCLWQNPVAQTVRTPLAAMSCLLSLAVICLNLSLFAPLAALLSISNIAMSILGGSFLFYHILFYARSFRERRLDWKNAPLWQAFFIFLWLVVLIPTDSRYSVYLFCAVAGTACLCYTSRQGQALPPKTIRTLSIFAGLFSLAVVLSNYPLFTPLFTLSSLLCCCAAFAGGICIGYPVLLAMMLYLPVAREPAAPQRPWRVFWLTVLTVFVICTAYLFSSCYPGLLTQDSVSTVEQILGLQPYNNTMPFWHTVTVLPFLKLGMAISGTVEGGIALFHIAQALFMAMCFGCVLATLYQTGVPTPALVAVGFLYACIPFNIVYSVTLWKDVPFAGAAVLFVVGLFRLLNQVGKSRKLNYFLLIFGAIGFSLWRTNGWYAFLATALVMALLMGKQHRKLLLVMVLVLVLCWILINPVLDSLSVSETNLVEAFAVPMQQVSRVVAYGRPLTGEQTELLSSIFWLDQVAELYNPLSVDPIKFDAFRHNQVGLVTENPLAYLRLYFELGMQYPADYLKAWIDETKGFWNGGYDYWIYTMGHHQEIHNTVERLFVSAFRFLNDTEVLKLFASAGLYVWGMIGCCLVNVLKKREEFLLSIPALVIILGLWIGTPVFCEFRYAYPVILTLPFIACVTMYKKEIHKGETT